MKPGSYVKYFPKLSWENSAIHLNKQIGRCFKTVSHSRRKIIDLSKYKGGFINVLIRSIIFAGRNNFIFLKVKLTPLPLASQRAEGSNPLNCRESPTSTTPSHFLNFFIPNDGSLWSRIGPLGPWICYRRKWNLQSQNTIFLHLSAHLLLAILLQYHLSCTHHFNLLSIIKYVVWFQLQNNRKTKSYWWCLLTCEFPFGFLLWLNYKAWGEHLTI